MLADAVTAAVTAVFTAPLILIAVTTIAAPWWRSQVGRALTAMEAGMSLALLPPFANRAAGGTLAAHPWFMISQASVWGVLALVVLRMAWVVTVTQWRARK